MRHRRRFCAGILVGLLGLPSTGKAQEPRGGVSFDEHFEDAKLTGRGWYDGDRFTLSDDAAGGDHSLHYQFRKGQLTPSDSSGLRHPIEPTDVVYLRFSLKLSPDWEWTRRPYGPHLLHFMTTENGPYHGPARSHLTVYIEPVNGKLRLAAQDMENEKAPHGLTQGPLRGGYNGRFFDSEDVLFDDGRWHRVEAMFRLNTLDAAKDRPNPDGELRGWVDGQLVIERTDVVFRSTDFPRMKFNQFLMLPYFHHGVPHDQSLRIDELAVGTGRIGPRDAKEGKETRADRRSRTFEMTYRATVRDIPEAAEALDLWLPLPQTDRNQTIHRISVDAPGTWTIGREPRFGNQSLHMRTNPPRGPLSVLLTVEATRAENGGASGPLSDEDRALYLKPEPLVPLDGPVRELAEEATRGLASEGEKARAIYETVTGLMTYDKSGAGWGRGDALFACEARRGNCTDFHALIIGMARSIGIPARFAIGLPLPEARGSGEVPGYHCWAELYVEGRGWVPVDGSEAAKDPAKRDYFFGHHDENRLEFSRGRHLTLVPPQQGPPLNFFVYPYAEVDGKPHGAIDRAFTFADRERP
jgi:transglutaminase-like putative cysteine protease